MIDPTILSAQAGHGIVMPQCKFVDLVAPAIQAARNHNRYLVFIVAFITPCNP
jgi:hypothetical protein